MLDKNAKKPVAPLNLTTPNSDTHGKTNGESCIIAKGTRIEGKFSTTEDVRLDGTIIGEMDCKKRIVMGDTGKIEGKVKTVDSTIRGNVKGEMKVSGILHLHETASIDGTIIARKMIVDSGAQYSGDIKVGDQHFAK